MALEIDMRPGRHITETKDIDLLACAYLLLEHERDIAEARAREAARQLGEAWALLTTEQWTTLLGREVGDDVGETSEPARSDRVSGGAT